MLPETQKQNDIKISEKKPKVNPYYLVLSGRFKTAKYITLCILVLFLLATVVLFRDEITVENLRYLFKDLEMGDNVNVSPNGAISYDADTQVDLALYKGDLAVAGGSSFFLCDLQGNKRLNENSVYSNPVVCTSDKYLLVYGLSEYTYTVYNTFSSLHTETFDYPITCAAVSDKGLYAIVTRTPEYRSVVYLYNENFKRIGAVYKDKYVMDVEFNYDSSELLITSIFSQNGNYCTEVMNYVPYSDTPSSSVVVEGSMALKIGYNTNGGYTVLYDNKIEFYDSEFVLRSTYNYPTGLLPVAVDISEKYTAITYNENIVGNNIKILVFDTDGNLILDADADGQPKKIQCMNDFVFVLLEGKVCRVDITNKNVDYSSIDRNSIEMVVVNDTNVLVGYSDQAIQITID